MHYIIYHDKSVEQVDDKSAEIIWEKSCQPGLQGIKLNGKMYKFASIAKIREEKDYFSEYPDKRPPEVRNIYQDNYGECNQQIRQPTEKARSLIKPGFIRYHLEQGRTNEQAEQKWNDMVRYGLDYKISKLKQYGGRT